MLRVGIDLGTTNTVVARRYDNGFHVIPRGRGRIIPSVVRFQWEKGEDDIIAGEEADRDQTGERVVRSIKRLMGRTYSEARNEGSEQYFPPQAKTVRMVLRGEKDLGLGIGSAGKYYWPQQITACILREARKHAEEDSNAPVTQATITVPAYFHDAHRKATLDAAALAGLDVIGELLDEPTAAALAFADTVGFSSGEQILVLDWGGGTFDVTVLSSDGEKWFQAAIAGDLTLGGDDIDRVFANMVLQRTGMKVDVLGDERNAWVLLKQTRLAKESLSEREVVPFACPPLIDPVTGRSLKPINIRVSRDDFETLIQDTLEKVIRIVDRCLRHQDVDREGIRHVLLVGGSSRIPLFQKKISELLPRARLHDEVDPMYAVALGAAIYANTCPEIARICPYGYDAVNVNEDDISVNILPPNTEVPTPVPMRRPIPAMTRYDGQTVYRLTFRSFTKHGNVSEYHDEKRLFARNMPATPAGTKFPVKVWLDENKTLQAECNIPGTDGPRRMEGREEGPDELFTRLLNRLLEAEATAEANKNASAGFIQQMRNLLVDSKVVLQSRDRNRAEELLEQLQEIMDLINTRQEDLLESKMLSNQEQAQHRIRGWLSFYEERLLPAFLIDIPSDQKERIITSIRGLRVMLTTGASGDELKEKHSELQDIMAMGDFGVVLEAARTGVTLGVPEKLEIALDEGSRAASEAWRRGDNDAFMEEGNKLKGLIKQAREACKVYYSTGEVIVASPDLDIGKE